MWRLRKWVVEMVDEKTGEVCDVRFMVGFGNIMRRLDRKIKRMENRRLRIDAVLSKHNR